MRIALLGWDQTAGVFLAQLAGIPQHDVSRACDLGSDADAFQRQFPHVLIESSWEGMLTGNDADIVFVARGEDDELRYDQIKKLLQEDMAVVASHPIHESSLIYYELELVREERNGVLLPYPTGRDHPLVDRLTEWLRDQQSGPGTVEQAVFQRGMPVRDQRNVRAAFARDVDLFRRLWGDVTQVSAMGSSQGDPYANLGVQLSGPSQVIMRWTVMGETHQSGAQIEIQGSWASATLEMPERGNWCLKILSGEAPAEKSSAGQAQVGEATPEDSPAQGEQRETPHTQSDPAESVPIESAPPESRQTESTYTESWNPAAAVLQQIERCRQGQPDSTRWKDAAMSIELTETLERSLRRGRTVQLHYEGRTELSAFKAIMTSVGCMSLLVALALIVIVVLIQSVGGGLPEQWPILILVLLVGFLLLQSLRFVLPSEEAPRDSEPRNGP
jgi:myo-inositol 2-dehydrogenase/D-chiro-inositol 1-dehydrogenase